MRCQLHNKILQRVVSYQTLGSTRPRDRRSRTLDVKSRERTL